MSTRALFALCAVLVCAPATASVIGANYFTAASSSTLGGSPFDLNLNHLTAQNGSQFISGINPPATIIPEVREVASASASFVGGTLRTLASASLEANPVSYHDIGVFAQALVGDTFTAGGTLSGQNLSLSFRINGFTNFIGDSPLNYLQSYTNLGFFVFDAGQWDDSLGGSHLLYARNYALEPNSVNDPNRPPDGSISPNSIATFDVPFDTIGSTFSLILFLNSSHSFTGDTNAPSHVSLNSINSFTANYYDTIEFAASAPNGITLSSASQAFPAALVPVPEPDSMALFAAGIVALAAANRRKTVKLNARRMQ